MRAKALAFDFLLASLTLGVIFTPLLALLSLAHGTALKVGFVCVLVGIVVTTFWAARQFDLPFPPWRPRSGRTTPGKRRYPPT